MQTINNLISIAGNCIGLASGIWLCIGTLKLSPKKISQMSDDSFDADQGTASTISAQSAEYLAGATLLLISFYLQILAALIEPANFQFLDPVFANSLVIVLATIFSIALSIPIRNARYAYLQNKLEEMRQAKG